MIVETADKARQQRVLAGQLMVTVVKPVTLVENGRREELVPGRHRFHRDHALVRARPELFHPCDPKDVETAQRHSALLGRTADVIRRKLGRPSARTTASRRRFTLPQGRSREDFRLP